MSSDFDSPASAVRAYGQGAVGLDVVAAVFDDFLAEGIQLEDLIRTVDDACDQAWVDADQHARLRATIADSMTLYAGPADATAEPAAEATATDADTEQDAAPISRTRVVSSADSAADDPVQVGPGTRLRDRFIIDEVLGAGGMGTVYRGRDALKLEARDRNPYLAIKVLNETFARRPDAFIALQREASRQQRLAHPNIATVFDFDRSGGTMFITMELLEGRTLDQFIRAEVRKRGGMPLDEAMPLIEQMCSALSHAHQRGIVHADFKPGNCFLTDSGELKVLDFGIARAMKDPAGSPQDQTLFDPRSMGALTPAYASPEMLNNSHAADPRDDLYALACVTYELLTGIHPFKRVPADEAMDQGQVPERIKALSRRQNATLQRGLAFEREARIGSADEFLQGLKDGHSFRVGRTVAQAGIAVLVLVVFGAIAVNYLRDMEQRRLADALAGGDPAAVSGALEDVLALAPGPSQRALVANRDALVSYFEARYQAQMAEPLDAVPFQAVAALLDTAARVLPDSAAVRDIQEDFTRRRGAYLSDLSERFDAFLQPEYLVPSSNRDDLHDLLQDIARVDPEHPLLVDLRVATAYADAARDAVSAGDLDAAQQIVNSGLVLRVDDPALLDIEDQINAAQEAAARLQRIDELERELVARSGAMEGPGDLAAVARLRSDLAALEPDSAALAEGTARAESWLAPRLTAALEADNLPELDQFLADYREPLEALGQGDRLQALASHRRELTARRDDLLTEVRATLTADAPLAARQGALQSALAEIERLDPALLAESSLAADIAQGQSSRAEVAAMAYDWDLARSELGLVTELGLGAETSSFVDERLRLLDEREQVFAAQVAADRAADAERRRATAIAAAERDVNLALDGLTLDGAGVDDLTAAARRLAALDGDNPLIGSANQQASERMLEAARAAADGSGFARAYALIELAEGLAPDAEAPALTRQAIQERESQYRAQRQQAAVDAAIADLERQLNPAAPLQDADARARVAQDLRALADIASAETVADLQARFAESYLNLADGLIEQKRFSAAETLLAEARGLDADAPGLAPAQRSLDAAREAYRVERARLEREAQVAAAEQRFRSELSSGQLERARSTLDEAVALAPDDSYLREEAPLALARSYALRVEQRVAAGDFGGAERALADGRAVTTDYPRWAALSALIAAERAHGQVDGWVADPGAASTEQVRGWLDDVRRHQGDAYPAQESAWIDRAVASLQARRGEPLSYNRALSRYQDVWPRAERLNLPVLSTAPVARATVETPARSDPAPRNEPAADRSAPAAPRATPDEPAAVADRDPPVPVATAEAETANGADDGTGAAAVVTESGAAAGGQAADVAGPAPEIELASLPTQRQAPQAPADPGLDPQVLLGRWCGGDVDLEFTSESLRFLLGRQAVEYRIEGYTSDGARNITVEWEDPRQGTMLMEFGDFSGDGASMQQLRGKRARDSDWQEYGRAFSRCG